MSALTDLVRKEERAGSPRSGRLHSGWFSRGYIPHFDAPGECQHVVFRLADALPTGVVERLKKTPKQDRFGIAESALDAGSGSRILSDPRVAGVVVETLLKFDGERYRLLAWCIMPNHVHVLIEQIEGWSLRSIVHSWKSFTAGYANGVLGRNGRFWAPDYFDRAMRDEAQTATTADYIEMNPVLAGICRSADEWIWSSAGARALGPHR